jgi:hypothetical protein
MDSTPAASMDLRDRLNAITAQQLGGRGRFKQLADVSGIGMDSWKNTWHNKQRPTTEMVQFVARAWPQYAFWLATGVTDARHGHQAPDGCDSYPENIRASRPGAEPYFRHAIDMLARRERGEPELLTDLVELRELATARANDEVSAEAAETMRDGAAIAATVQALDADTPPKAETLTGRLLTELQSGRQLTDQQMARLLGVDDDTYLDMKSDTSKIKKLAMGRIFDAWAYDAIRDALLKVAPDRFAQAIRQRDIERGRRLLSR